MKDVVDVAERLAAHLEEHTSHLPTTVRQLGQLLKVQEEAGEVAEAAIGVLGMNPRKGDRSYSWDDVQSELCDVVITGLVALFRLDPVGARGHLAAHLGKFTFDEDLPAVKKIRPEQWSKSGGKKGGSK